MIYDTSEHKLEDLLKNERLLSSIMESDTAMTENEARDKIKLAYEKSSSHTEKPAPVKSMDHQPCSCGSTDFMRTGTCFVCRTCGSSQGCS